MREVCLARRIRTNTPLQALVTLNDSVFVEAARRLAVSVWEKHADSPAENRIALIYSRATGRQPGNPQLTPLLQLYAVAERTYQTDPARRGEMTGCDPHRDDPGLAALVLVANAIFNLDAFVVKP
jgi:hypothetical protein